MVLLTDVENGSKAHLQTVNSLLSFISFKFDETKRTKLFNDKTITRYIAPVMICDKFVCQERKILINHNCAITIRM
jgi:hypothetical protein